jgi:hypothetical protein
MTANTSGHLSRDTAYDDEEDYDPGPSNWTGWVAFGAAMIMLMGTMNVIQGLVSLLDDGYYLTNADGLSVHLSYTTVGWIQLGLGVVALAIGIGMFAGVTVALVAGVILAGVSAIANVATIAAYPLWGIVLVAFDVIVIYAIVAHGREMKRLR